MTITTLVVDDEPLARRAIVRLLQDDADIVLLGEYGDGLSASRAIREHSPDLVFLDIQMPAMSGMDVVGTIGASRMPATVFVTAFEEYAVRAFEANAVDYLVKPFSRDRFADTLGRAKARISRAVSSPPMPGMQQVLDALRERSGYADRLPVRVDDEIALIDVDDIVWIKATRNTVQVNLADRSFELRETMAALGERLDPKRFARIHRSAIINIRRVRTIQPWFNGYHVVTMDTGQKLRMSRYQQEAFMRLLGGGSGVDDPVPAR
jgi:two-component system LytT family response regulator